MKATATRDHGGTSVNEYITDENGNITSCDVTLINEDGSEGSMSWRHEYTYAYVEDPSLAVRMLANEHDFFYM